MSLLAIDTCRQMNPFEFGNRKSHTWYFVLEHRIKDDVKTNVEPTGNTEYQGDALGLDEKVFICLQHQQKKTGTAQVLSFHGACCICHYPLALMTTL